MCIEILCKKPVPMPRDVLSRTDFFGKPGKDRTWARMSTWTILGVMPWGALGSLWPAFGLPLAILGHMEPAWNSWKIHTIIDERGCLTSKPMITDGRGEHPSKIIDIDYREICQIHETVVKNQLLWICMAVPQVQLVPRKWCHKVLLGPPRPRARGQDDVSFTSSLKLWYIIYIYIYISNTLQTHVPTPENKEIRWKMMLGPLISMKSTQINNNRITEI